MILGGAADLTIRQLLPGHREFLGFLADPVPPATEMLVLALLHALGAALIAVGLAVLVLLREAQNSGRSGPTFAAAGIVVLAEGANAAGMYSIGSPLFVAPLIFILLVLVGVALFTSAKTGSAVHPTGG